MQKETNPGGIGPCSAPVGIGVLAGMVPRLGSVLEPRTFPSGLIEPEVWQALTDKAVTTIAKLRPNHAQLTCALLKSAPEH